jgi:hypothetical protein
VIDNDRDYLLKMKSAGRAVAVLGLVLLVVMISHKAFIDVSALAQQYSGSEFWAALGRQLLQNLAGG